LSAEVKKKPFVFIAFAVFSVPGGVLAARIGKKKLLLLGLLRIFATGCQLCAFLFPAQLASDDRRQADTGRVRFLLFGIAPPGRFWHNIRD
jgi:MFS family permease